MLTDVEAAKKQYLSRWNHCPGKAITACDGSLICDCGERLPWTRALGEDVALALELEWLTPTGESLTVSDKQQPEMF
jgi:hypothetical protein